MLQIKMDDSIRFLLRAMADSDDRDSKYRLDTIKAMKLNDESMLVAGDGTRLHMITNEYDVPEGIYVPIENKRRKMVVLEVVEEALWPDIDGLMQKIDGYGDWAEYTCHEEPKLSRHGISSMSIGIKKLYEKYDQILNLWLVKELGEGVFNVKFNRGVPGPVCFDRGNRIAVLMPMVLI